MYFKNLIEEIDTKDIVSSEYVNWDFYKNSTIMITGATGLIGSQIVTSILYANETLGSNIKILALVRNLNKAKKLFENKLSEKLIFVVQDIIEIIKITEKVDYIIHTANSTSSKSFVETPVETINSIVFGTKNVLEFAKNSNVKSIVYLSSMEVYGETDFERIEPLKENDYGYVDILKPRSSYPEGKRLAECMCSAYAKEFGLNVKIARLVQTIGAGVNYDDNRVFAEFARRIVEKENIILQTTGESTRSYCYVTDAITAMFVLLERGEQGECYNVSNSKTVCSIKKMAEMLCEKYTTSKLEIKINPNNYYPPATKLNVDTTKLNLLNWEAKIDLVTMLEKLIKVFESRNK